MNNSGESTPRLRNNLTNKAKQLKTQSQIDISMNSSMSNSIAYNQNNSLMHNNKLNVINKDYEQKFMQMKEEWFKKIQLQSEFENNNSNN